MKIPAMLGLAAACAAAPAAAPAADACRVHSGERAPVVVELYTSEGCNSCPPADRWLSSVNGRDDVVALAFHVDYWDRLGWKDRFASPDYTARQMQLKASSGARFAYTPQVIADGRDWREWPGLPPAAATRVDLQLERRGARIAAEIAPRPGAPARLAGYWAVVEDGHTSDVRAGENAGVTLHHDAVVRTLQAIAPFAGTERLEFDAEPAARRRVVLVVTDAASGRPVQALACPG